jgi:hypothetical protein
MIPPIEQDARVIMLFAGVGMLSGIVIGIVIGVFLWLTDWIG